jgi:F0F1-type ATP synthase membrane subunit c/vacuolar-type H+-ATPase subunit K
MLAFVKYIGAGLIGAGAGIGTVFGSLILATARNPQLKGQFFNYAILGFMLAEATGFFAFVIGFIFSTFLILLAIIGLIKILKFINIIKLVFLIFFICVNIIFFNLADDKESQMSVEYMESASLPTPVKNALSFATGAATFFGTDLAYNCDTKEQLLIKKKEFQESIARDLAKKEISNIHIKANNLSNSLRMKEISTECGFKMEKLAQITGQMKTYEEGIQTETDPNKKSVFEYELRNFHNEHERLRNSINSLVKEQQNIANFLITNNVETNTSEEIKDKIHKSSIIDFDSFFGGFEKLNIIEKMACCFIVSGGAILSCILSIILTLYGDYLLDKFKLETRYPKLAKIILLRKKLHSYYLKINIFWIVLIGLGNMFFGFMMIYG